VLVDNVTGTHSVMQDKIYCSYLSGSTLYAFFHGDIVVSSKVVGIGQKQCTLAS